MIYSNVVDNPALENTVLRNERPIINVTPVIIYNILNILVLLFYFFVRIKKINKENNVNIFRKQWLLISLVKDTF